MITELEQKATEEAVGNEVLEKMGDMIRERECIERKLSTTYSLGRDRTDLQSKSLIPLYKGKAKSSSFQSAKESVAIFYTLSDTSSREGSTEGDISILEGMDSSTKAKAKVPMEEETSSDEEFYGRGCVSEPKTSSKLSISCHGEQERSKVKSLEEEEKGPKLKNRSSTWLKRRKTLSSIN